MAASSGVCQRIDRVLRAESYAEAVPYMDYADGDRDRRHFSLRKEITQRFEVSVRRSSLRNIGQCLGPGKNCPLARVEDRRLLPNADQVDPLLAEAVATCFLDVHVHAIGAAIDSRGS